MKITKYSINRLKASAVHWEVSQEYFHPIYNYLVHGFSPGGFFTAVLANDFFDAVARSHPGNTITTLQKLTGWLRSTEGYGIFWGDYNIVDKWIRLSETDRRIELEKLDLIFPESKEIIMTLRGDPCHEVYFLS